MIVILLALAGAMTGALMARRRGGKALDLAQHAAVLAIIGAILGLFITIALSRLM